MDAGTTIIKTTLTAAKDSPVNVFADDTDILSLLIHHMTNSSTDVYNIYITNVKKEQRRECYNVTDTLNALENHVIKYLLFAHAFTGCDTTSAINNFGKTSLFKKLKDSVALTNIGDVFYEEFKTPEEIGNACTRFFEKMYSPSYQLPQIRKRSYDEIVRTDGASIGSLLLPPSTRAAYYHGLSVYHQIKVWKALSDTDLEPIQWGWKLRMNHSSQSWQVRNLVLVIFWRLFDVLVKKCLISIVLKGKLVLHARHHVKNVMVCFVTTRNRLEKRIITIILLKVVILDIFLMHFCKIIYYCSYIV